VVRDWLETAVVWCLQLEQAVWNGVAVQKCLERHETEGSRHTAMCSTK
jgi:hypothetical protein